MNKLCTIVIAMTAFCMLGVPRVLVAETISPEAVKVFGERDGQRVNNGIVFVDGLYIRAPYVVSRKGNGIVINGRYVAMKLPIAAEAPKPKPVVVKPVVKKTPKKVVKKGDSIIDELGVADLLDDDGDNDDSDTDQDQEVVPVEENIKPEPDDDVPTLDESVLPKAPSPAGSAIERILANRKRSNYDLTALFEEADYTYAPPKKPEPKAVPYIRPTALLSTKERLAQAKALDAARQAAATKARASGDDAQENLPSVAIDVVEEENFDGLSPERIARAVKFLDDLCKHYEGRLAKNEILIFSGGASRATSLNVSNQNRVKFFVTMKDAFDGQETSETFVKAMHAHFPYVSGDFLTKIFDQRSVNARLLRLLEARLSREERAKKAARDDRLR